jgi:hypothetical protein
MFIEDHPLTFSRTCDVPAAHEIYALHAFGEHDLVDGTCGKGRQKEGLG